MTHLKCHVSQERHQPQRTPRITIDFLFVFLILWRIFCCSLSCTSSRHFIWRQVLTMLMRHCPIDYTVYAFLRNFIWWRICNIPFRNSLGRFPKPQPRTTSKILRHWRKNFFSASLKPCLHCRYLAQYCVQYRRRYCTLFTKLGQKKWLYLCPNTQGGQGKYYSGCRVSLSPALSP